MLSDADIDRARYLAGHVKDNLDTTKHWSLHDFRDFYQRDIAAAIQLAEAVLREPVRPAKRPDYPCEQCDGTLEHDQSTVDWFKCNRCGRSTER